MHVGNGYYRDPTKETPIRKDIFNQPVYSRGMELLDPEPSLPSWTFLTNHAHVLIAIDRNPDLRQRDISHAVGITVGAVQRIIHELEADGYLKREKIGRRNRYQVNPDLGLRHPLESNHSVGDLLRCLD